ncbi:MAG: Asp-tRNA(Asn)/Glu-tRNA(Gln) amidotransferase GatCAB subunit C [Pelagibacterales bacterium]|nr:Asp-tRNA(Asn)/Glu-tRNA(Gln) amidotransferase GatCAB subunit C [Pelagibacterales bacterium]OUU62332.1 MAG: aspartyl/glutamyl-tRNA(Asn/Gln) amidotransferase subunit C [Alphaproteobacteria bacterium TMED62]|tara:strand:- start:2697 stop:2987 length:291 start_codon:yes stop_codon:yes gene_type:complete
MLIDEKITRKIATLAKIDLSEQEIKEYTKDLNNILKWMEELKEVDVSNIKPVTSITENKLYERDDISHAIYVEQEKVLLNAPDKVGDYFTVPKVIE